MKYSAFLSILVIALTTAVGCQPTKSKSSKIKLWPILEASSSTMVEDDGSWSKSENGDAILIVHWRNNKSYSSNGKIKHRKDNLEIWPLFDCHSSESGDNKTCSGNILVFNYDSNKSK